MRSTKLKPVCDSQWAIASVTRAWLGSPASMSYGTTQFVQRYWLPVMATPAATSPRICAAMTLDVCSTASTGPSTMSPSNIAMPSTST